MPPEILINLKVDIHKPQKEFQEGIIQFFDDIPSPRLAPDYYKDKDDVETGTKAEDSVKKYRVDPRQHPSTPFLLQRDRIKHSHPPDREHILRAVNDFLLHLRVQILEIGGVSRYPNEEFLMLCLAGILIGIL